ncbi:MAG TPA: response regulator transcription factor [Abditibacteriaceae bacterium]|jgi:DNA-binding NarL/FixJ family response regulator
MKILIADDHTVVREGLMHILLKEWPTAEFGEAICASDVMQLLHLKTWDVVILDINMPGQSGLELLQDIKQDYPKLPVLILTMHPEEQYAMRAIKLGAAGYLLKDSAGAELILALHKLVAGGRYISSTLAERMANALADDNNDRPCHELLSDRELVVLCGIASGKTVTEIAVDLSLSVKTVSSYRARLLQKMAMRTNAQLMHYAISNQLVTDIKLHR